MRAEGTIQVIDGVQDPFNEVKVNNDWPDIFHSNFQCQTCDQRFILSVETFHGAGGYWGSIE